MVPLTPRAEDTHRLATQQGNQLQGGILVQGLVTLGQLQGVTLVMHQHQGATQVVHRHQGATQAVHRHRGVTRAVHRHQGATPAVHRHQGATPAVHRHRGVTQAVHRLQGVTPAVHQHQGVTRRCTSTRGLPGWSALWWLPWGVTSSPRPGWIRAGWGVRGRSTPGWDAEPEHSWRQDEGELTGSWHSSCVNMSC